jgi:hypothetical protein
MDLLTLHFLSFIITLPVILYADHLGFMYFSGRRATLDRKKVAWSHWLVFLGLTLLIVTGIMLTVRAWDVFLSDPFFYTKIAFVATLFINGIFITSLMNKAMVTPYVLLSRSEKRLLLSSGAISTMSWVATIAIALFIL